MKENNNIENIAVNFWELDQMNIFHSIIDYNSLGKQCAKNNSEEVRLHFGLQGSYDFSLPTIKDSFSLSGHHNNIMFSDSKEFEIYNKSEIIETFGINFKKESFIEIGQNGNEPLKIFTEKVIKNKNSILSPKWRMNNFKIQQTISEIINCSYSDELKNIFLLAKSIELLVIQADLHENKFSKYFIKTRFDKEKLIEAKEILNNSIEKPPSIIELAKLIGINEYKLKKGFKEQFGVTVFGYIHSLRMNLAKRLLLDTTMSAKEIAYQIGYSSPQYFTNAFKKHYKFTPNSIRKNPDITIS